MTQRVHGASPTPAERDRRGHGNNLFYLLLLRGRSVGSLVEAPFGVVVAVFVKPHGLRGEALQSTHADAVRETKTINHSGNMRSSQTLLAESTVRQPPAQSPTGLATRRGQTLRRDAAETPRMREHKLSTQSTDGIGHAQKDIRHRLRRHKMAVFGGILWELADSQSLDY